MTDEPHEPDVMIVLRAARELLAELAAPTAVPQPANDLVLSIPAETLRQRPDVRAAEYQVTAAAARVAQADAALLKFAFELAQSRPKKHLTSATKSNGISISMPYWDERCAEMAKAYPGLTLDKFHIDILTAHFVQRPAFFDVVVASNLFGDILSDLGPACTGTIGIAPSANINPDRKFPSLFEPVHGSAPDIAGKGIANPIGQIWCGAMMLEWLGHKAAHDAILAACEKSTASAMRTPDLGGTASTADVGRFIAESL